MSCRVSSIAAASPAGPAPTTSTGMSSNVTASMVRAATPGHMSNRYSNRTPADQTASMRWPFTGREAELRLVGEALADGSTSGVVIAGPAGVGKTRLAAEAAELAAAQGCAVAWVRASRSARSIPLGAFAALLPATDRGLPEGVELLARARHALPQARRHAPPGPARRPQRDA